MSDQPQLPDDTKETKASIEGNKLSMGIGLGIAIGAGIGIALDNLALGMGIGVAIGSALGVSMNAAEKKKQSPGEKTDE